MITFLILFDDHFFGFLIMGFKFQKSVCYGCHDLLMMSLNISNITIITVKGANYHDISKSDAIHLLENSVLHN